MKMTILFWLYVVELELSRLRDIKPSIKGMQYEFWRTVWQPGYKLIFTYVQWYEIFWK